MGIAWLSGISGHDANSTKTAMGTPMSQMSVGPHMTSYFAKSIKPPSLIHSLSFTLFLSLSLTLSLYLSPLSSLFLFSFSYSFSISLSSLFSFSLLSVSVSPSHTFVHSVRTGCVLYSLEHAYGCTYSTMAARGRMKRAYILATNTE